MEKFLRIIESFKEKLKGDRKKLIESCVIVIIIGVIIVIAAGAFLDKEDTKKANASEKESLSKSLAIQSEESQEIKGLEEELKAILTQIAGSGKVDVMITYTSGKEIVPAYDLKNSEDNTEEKDGGGGSRKISKSSTDSGIAYEEVAGGEKKPIVLKEILPKVKGVVIVADGASNPKVSANLYRAAQTLLDIQIHRISVFERKR